MYEIGDAITGTGVQQAPAGMPPEQIKQSWLEYFNRPEVQAGLLQFGAQALQPVPIGQTTAGHFGQALTSGMQAAGRIASQEDERKRAAAQEAKLEAEAARAEAQAAQEGERATLAREGMQVDRERLQADKDYRQTSLQLEREKMTHAAELEKSRQAAAYSVAKLVHGSEGKLSEDKKALIKMATDAGILAISLSSSPAEAKAKAAEVAEQVRLITLGLPLNGAENKSDGSAASVPTAKTKTRMSEVQAREGAVAWVQNYEAKTNTTLSAERKAQVIEAKTKEFMGN